MHIYITHGFEAYPQKHWFMWLKDTLAKKGIHTTIPAMPNAANPTPSEWIRTLQNEVTHIDTQSYFIGHSLGCIATLRFLQTLDREQKIGGIVLVSGFDSPLQIYPNLNEFTKEPLEYDKLISLSHNRLVISARDDCIVPTKLSANLAQNLQATFIQTHKGGHFMQDDGFQTFPLLAHLLEFYFFNTK